MGHASRVRHRRLRGRRNAVEPIFAEVLVETKRFIETEARQRKLTICRCLDDLVQELQWRRGQYVDVGGPMAK